jgi:hypothetical protein
LCHSDSRITEIYVHASEQRKRAAINSLEKTNIFQRIKQRLFPSKAIHILPLSYGETDFHIGRKQELERLADLTDKRVNILVMGSQGIGKSHLLDNFTLEKILRIDDCKEFRKTLAGMIVKLCNEDKEEVARLLNLNTDVVTKESQKRLIEILCSITDKQEYTLIFDDVSKLTPTAVTALEKLRGHFHIIAAARSVEVKNATWLTNFEKIELKPLNRLESIELIERVAENFKGQIEDFEAFKNHIFNSTNGIPQFIIEMVQRYQKEKFVRADAVLTINHTAARGEISAVPFLFLLIGCLVILKFWGREAMPDDKEAFMLIGGGALVVLMFGRFAFSKRKFV